MTLGAGVNSLIKDVFRRFLGSHEN